MLRDATPTDDVSTLNDYWTYANGDEAKSGLAFMPSAVAPRLAEAIAAMTDLVSAAGTNTYTRSAVFAPSAVFSTALLSEPEGVTDQLLASSDDYTRAALQSATRPPRQIMLDAIYKAGAGGLFSARDFTGVASWISAVEIGGAGMAYAVANDPNPNVRAAALKILADLAIPAGWVQQFAADRTLNTFDEQLPRSAWDQATRATLQALSAKVRARFTMLAAAAAQANLPQLTLPDGSATGVLPPAPKPWYQNVAVVGPGLAGLVGGAVARARATRPATRR